MVAQARIPTIRDVHGLETVLSAADEAHAAYQELREPVEDAVTQLRSIQGALADRFASRSPKGVAALLTELNRLRREEFELRRRGTTPGAGFATATLRDRIRSLEARVKKETGVTRLDDLELALAKSQELTSDDLDVLAQLAERAEAAKSLFIDLARRNDAVRRTMEQVVRQLEQFSGVGQARLLPGTDQAATNINQVLERVRRYLDLARAQKVQLASGVGALQSIIAFTNKADDGVTADGVLSVIRAIGAVTAIGAAVLTSVSNPLVGAGVAVVALTRLIQIVAAVFIRGGPKGKKDDSD